MYIVTRRKTFFILAGAFVALALGSLAVFGLSIGPDFTGGTLAEARYSEGRPAIEELRASLDAAGLSGYLLRTTEEDGYILRAGVLADEERAALPEALSLGGAYPASIERLTEVGPTVGVELRNKALVALVLVALLIVLFIAFAFRKVSEPVSSWMYGFIAIVTLLFDVLVPVGAFAFFGYLWGAQVDALFVTALLAILGYSVNDTIVVFDRVRENLRLNQEGNVREDFAETAGRSLKQTYARSINTSLTTLLVLAALYVFGPSATQDFALTLIVGVIAGTYSSIALATPLLVAVAHRRVR
ncbi:protein translocase subunit SecF [Candidatus Kaiserbacteria bacterium CG10_big_fil_rev_8_21_14_0_10_59_10]|uniref:Protein-export membrane protein SecF n=1 Tax=Candidatus Kaiserbacteria bacterium CG10_big_fil_rev_8_21_14_0_10_59_10 TaxID=1974612 RepID=A0A2H0U8J9_9BACT|nr:MAG: protein translocase subunit SecF [Candidatus Kaiserbacteria bacterium CG10_big_fil_rev_8_21_14_0_10_59_10]